MDTTSVIVKIVPPSDIGQLIAIDVSAFSKERHNLSEEFDIAHARIYGTYQGPRLLGFVNIRVIFDQAEILAIGVEPRFQRSGIGSLLMKKMFDDLPQVKRFYLEVRESNAAAISFYEKWDFALTGSRQRYYHDGEGARVMIRKQE